LAAARRVLEREGWQAATAERIAREAGVSRVTLHRHGLTRETILGELADAAAERYRDAMWPILTSPASADERIERALTTLCELAEENLSLLQALDAQANASVFHEESTTQALTRDQFTEPLERLLRDGASEGTLRELDDPLSHATVLFNLVGWTYIHLRSGHRWAPESARQATVDVALNGIRVRRAD
jgi:AcrR family transcriptional regulator